VAISRAATCVLCSPVVSQYRAPDPEPPLADGTARVVSADFAEAFATSRRGVVTEFRNTATDWGVDFDTLDVPVTLWHGEGDTNVPTADVRRFEAALPEATLTVETDADHLGTLVESMPEILERAGG